MIAPALKVLGQMDRLGLVVFLLVLLVADGVASASTDSATNEGASGRSHAAIVSDNTTDYSTADGASGGLVFSVVVVISAVGKAEGCCCQEGCFEDGFHQFGIWLLRMVIQETLGLNCSHLYACHFLVSVIFSHSIDEQQGNYSKNPEHRPSDC